MLRHSSVGPLVWSGQAEGASVGGGELSYSDTNNKSARRTSREPEKLPSPDPAKVSSTQRQQQLRGERLGRS